MARSLGLKSFSLVKWEIYTQQLSDSHISAYPSRSLFICPVRHLPPIHSIFLSTYFVPEHLTVNGTKEVCL